MQPKSASRKFEAAVVRRVVLDRSMVAQDGSGVYRGAYLLSRSEACRGMAWTNSYEVAAWFAMRFGQARPLVLRAEAKRAELVFHHVERSEDEVISSRDTSVAETTVPNRLEK